MAIAVQNRRQQPRITTARVRQLARCICDGLDLRQPELSVVLTDDATIQEINRTWRGKDKATDVLSFSQVEGEAVVQGRAGSQPRARMVLGDVIISMETAARQAVQIGHSLDEEFARLLVHGVLHLLGHDHVHGGLQARRMKAEETRLLKLIAALSITLP